MRGLDSVCDSSAMDSAIASVTTRQTIQRRPKSRLATEKHTPATRPLTAAPISCLDTATLRKPLEEPTDTLELDRASSNLEGMAAWSALLCGTPEAPAVALEFVRSSADHIGRTRSLATPCEALEGSTEVLTTTDSPPGHTGIVRLSTPFIRSPRTARFCNRRTNTA